jgi:dephospho-CoA kinase
MRELKNKLIELSSQKRLHELAAPIVGLTGGIATGKSTVSKILQSKGCPIIDADQLVKKIYALNDTKEFIKANFPEGYRNGEIDFPALRQRFFQDPKAKSDIEGHIYQRLPDIFLKEYRELGTPPFIIYDVPLLFEKKLDLLVDITVTVYAPRKIQEARLMKRDGILEDLAKKIIDQQMDIEDKKLKADFVIDNSFSQEELVQEVEELLRQILKD